MKSNTILMGQVNAGKTTALRTIIGRKKLFLTALEPGVLNILGDIPCSSDFHFHYIAPADVDWATLIDNAEKINKFMPDALQKMPGMNKDQYTQFIDLLSSCSNLKCDRCGEVFGALDDLDDSWAFAIDGLSGLSKIGYDLHVGGKIGLTQPEFGIIMGNIQRFLDKCTTSTKCSFILTSHLDKELDVINGGYILTLDTIGNKLGPKIPKMFDEAVLCYREGEKYFWSTTRDGVSVKHRVLPPSDKLPPDFAQIFKEKLS